MGKKGVVEKIDKLLQKTGLPVDAPDYPDKDYIKAMKLDKKVVGDDLRFVLAEAIGKVNIKTVAQTTWTHFSTPLRGISAFTK